MCRVINMRRGEEATALPALLHLCDGLFPIGAFAHSDGLETVTATDRVKSGSDLRHWMDATLDEVFGRAEGPALLLAWQCFDERRWTDLRDLESEVYALRSSLSARQSGRAMGARLLKMWQEIWPH